ncbi:MAG: hypothetical protein JSW37_13020 [Anaerolineales bacterium]|nr:MAG: hypothetical protein JSW37_13020 [Anaerolineales bacterium]
MTALRRIHACVLFMIALALIWGLAPASGGSVLPQNKLPGWVESNTRRLMHELEKDGYEVSRGYFKLYTEEDCPDSWATMGSCYGNNPAAPYVVPVVPHWPEEFVDPATELAFGPTVDGYHLTYRLDPREAIVVLAQMPPPAAYFGLQSYLFTREGTWDTNSIPYWFVANYLPNLLTTFFSIVPGNPDRIQPFASLSNSINNVVIEDQSGSAFGQVRYFVITPDQFMDAAIRQAFAGIAVEEDEIFTEAIPSYIRTGPGESSDELLSVIRYTDPEDGGNPGTASDRWRNELPLVVLRVRDIRPDRQPEPFPDPVLDTRTAASELGLAADQLSLVMAVAERWGQPCQQPDCSDRAKTFLDLQRPPLSLVGPLCTEVGMNCFGDTQDTTYQFMGQFELDEGQVYAVAGTLGTRTENAVYVGLGVNRFPMKKGVANLFDSELEGTADGYADDVANSDLFYLYYFARDCTGLEALTDGNCLSITGEMIPICPEPGDPACDRAVFSERDYIRPGTQRGPESLLELPAAVIMLETPAQ